MQRREIEEVAQERSELVQRYTPEVVVFDTPEEVDEFVASRLIQQVQTKSNSVLTLPTGNTPVGMYRKIVEAYQSGDVDFSGVSVFNLDEYYPIDSTHPSSYTAFMRRNFIDHVPVRSWYIPDGE